MRIFSILVTLLCVSASLSKVHAADRPNIIVVFIDDMGYSDFSCFGGTVETQHVDRLAAEAAAGGGRREAGGPRRITVTE